VKHLTYFFSRPLIVFCSVVFSASLLFWPFSALATFSVTEDFECYSVGTLAGGSGGSGWSANWVSGNVYSSPVHGGSRTGGDNAQGAALQRYFTAEAAGLLTLYFRTYSASDNAAIYVQDATSNKIILQPCYTGGVWRFYMDGSYQTTGTCAANTWYKVDIQWDDAATADSWRFRIDDGTWIGWGATNGTFSTFDNIKIWSAAGGYSYVDDISGAAGLPADPTSSTTPPIVGEIFFIWYGYLAALCMMSFFLLIPVLWVTRKLLRTVK